MPLTKLFSRALHKLLVGFDEDHHQAVQEVATSKSNKHHRLQLDHLVPLDAISQCNTLESHSLAMDSHSCKHK